MNFLNIIHDDLANNSDGVGVTLFVSGCDGHSKCVGCHNPDSWSYEAGSKFDDKAREEIYSDLDKSYVSTLTISGGDPLSPGNLKEITSFVKEVRRRYPEKKIWLYTGFLYEDVRDLEIMNYINVLVDGPFIQERRNEKCLYYGSDNQRIIKIR